MAKAPKNAISPTREEDYPEWYQQVVSAADLAENSPVRGCMVIKPWGYAIWENMQRTLDRMFKDTGHRERVLSAVHSAHRIWRRRPSTSKGFAKECAVVTHHRLEAGPEGGLRADRQARRAAGRAADQRNHHRRDVRQVGAVLPRPADPHQPMGERRPLGAAHADVPSHDRVPLAGRAYGARHARKRPSKRR